MLVTGADGQLGCDVMRQAARRGIAAMGLGRAQLDITDADNVRRVFDALRPKAVIHCAAYTAVDAAETDRDRAFAINAEGAETVARAAADIGAHLVFVSTDYVFAGDDPCGATEATEPNPCNVYGASKLAGETAVRAALPTAAVVRTSWLFGAHGANFVHTILRLAATKDEIEVIDDQRGSPTWTVHLADLLLACATDRVTGIVHGGGAPDASWFAVAQAVVEAMGSRTTCVVKPTSSAEYVAQQRAAGKVIAPRPECSILRSTRTDITAVGDWRDGVRQLVAASLAAH